MAKVGKRSFFFFSQLFPTFTSKVDQHLRIWTLIYPSAGMIKTLFLRKPSRVITYFLCQLYWEIIFTNTLYKVYKWVLTVEYICKTNRTFMIKLYSPSSSNSSYLHHWVGIDLVGEYIYLFRYWWTFGLILLLVSTNKADIFPSSALYLEGSSNQVSAVCLICPIIFSFAITAVVRKE